LEEGDGEGEVGLGSWLAFIKVINIDRKVLLVRFAGLVCGANADVVTIFSFVVCRKVKFKLICIDEEGGVVWSR
jgi:hypothetical protein